MNEKKPLTAMYYGPNSGNLDIINDLDVSMNESGIISISSKSEGFYIDLAPIEAMRLCLHINESLEILNTIITCRLKNDKKD